MRCAYIYTYMYLLAISPISTNCKRKQAGSYNRIGNLDSFPHWYSRGMLLIWWHSGLQHTNIEFLIMWAYSNMQVRKMAPFAKGIQEQTYYLLISCYQRPSQRQKSTKKFDNLWKCYWEIRNIPTDTNQIKDLWEVNMTTCLFFFRSN